jgi:hypothetical protein
MSKILFYNNIERINWQVKKTVYNNRYSLDPKIISKITSFDPSYLVKEKVYLDRNPLTVIGQLSNTPSPIDRTGYLEFYKMSYNSIPKYEDNFNKSYRDIALNRAKQIWEMNDSIDVLFDGNNESIVSCLSLIETKTNNKKLRIIDLKSTNNFDIPILKEFVIIKNNKDFFNIENLTSNNTIITSNFPSIDGLIFQNLLNFIDLNTVSYKHLFLHYRTKMLGKEWQAQTKITLQDEIKHFIKFLDNHSKQSPLLIKSVADMLWWLTFTFADNHANYIVPAMFIDSIKSIKIKKINLSSYINFFNDIDWQLWHMKNYDVSRNINIFSYETEKFIKDIFSLNKLKVINKDKFEYNLTDTNFLILDDGTVVYTNNLMYNIIEEIL